MNVMNERISVLVVDDDEKYDKELVSYIKGRSEHFLDAAYAVDGEEGLEVAKLIHPDVIILDQLMPRLDGIGFLRRLRYVCHDHKPIIIMNSVSRLTGMLRTAAEYGMSYYMVKPQLCSEICDTIIDLYRGRSAAEPPKRGGGDKLEAGVTAYLRHLGVPAHLTGYKYMRSALMMTIKDISLLTPITKKLYPMIADKYGTNNSCVERAMRHAIGVSWERGDKKLLNDIFGYSSESGMMHHRPTNSEYIAMAADDFRLKMKYGSS